ncbi:Hypothetical protein A7982_04959 [Minicystis rosea]|nr:Hypothetical protein A7982_04959 [Minicystis rosea]
MIPRALDGAAPSQRSIVTMLGNGVALANRSARRSVTAARSAP